MTETQHRLADEKEMPAIGSEIGGRYEIRSVLGEGGFAAVYRSFDKRTRTEVAIKVLDPMMSRRREFSARFLREVETVSRLKHHNTIKIFDSGETDTGCLFLVMELLEGKPLDTILEQGGPMAPARVQHICLQVLKSLHEAHQLGIIHRDLKPANVFIANMLGEQDYVKVLDFGIAKTMDEGANTSLTATGQVMCSPDYVSPERVRDHASFPASDLYSLGVMMLEMLEGELPYKGDSPMMVALQHARVDQPVPMLETTASGPLGAVIRKAVEKDVTLRYQSAEEMLADLVEADCGGLLAGPRATVAGRAVSSANQTVAASMGRATVTDLDGAQVADAPRSRLGVIVAAVVVLAVVAAVVIVMATRGAGPASEPVAAAVVTTPEAPPATDEPQPSEVEEPAVVVAAPRDIQLRISPAQDTQVLFNDQFAGYAQNRITLPQEDAYPVTLRFERPGFETYERVITSAGDFDALNREGVILAAIPEPEPEVTAGSSRRSGSSSSRRDDSGSSSSSSSSSSGSSGSSSSSSSSSPDPAPSSGRLGRTSTITPR